MKNFGDGFRQVATYTFDPATGGVVVGSTVIGCPETMRTRGDGVVQLLDSPGDVTLVGYPTPVDPRRAENVG